MILVNISIRDEYKYYNREFTFALNRTYSV
jgi:hypothetical protein